MFRSSASPRPSAVSIFQQIIDREIPADIVHEDELCLAFKDINPQAPTHILVIPKKPIPRVGEASPQDKELLGHLLLTASAIATQLGVNSTTEGFRLIINNGANGGEAVPHLHVHLLAGRPLLWPPG
jgi:histidine triad (HIT) family protein